MQIHIHCHGRYMAMISSAHQIYGTAKSRAIVAIILGSPYVILLSMLWTFWVKYGSCVSVLLGSLLTVATIASYIVCLYHELSRSVYIGDEYIAEVTRLFGSQFWYKKIKWDDVTELRVIYRCSNCKSVKKVELKGRVVEYELLGKSYHGIRTIDIPGTVIDIDTIVVEIKIHCASICYREDVRI